MKPKERYKIHTPKELSRWKCYLFGINNGTDLAFRPGKGGAPNWFWRKMQYLMFGNKWVKEIRK